MALKLSILICGTPARVRTHALPLFQKLLAQTYQDERVEILYLLDNKKRSVGDKRQSLLDISKGEYITYCDDDDDVEPDYIESLLGAMETSPDVITFEQIANVAGHLGQIRFGLGNPNQDFNPDAITLRNAWHVCAWRRSIGQQFRFPDMMDGEDWAWAEQCCAVAKSSVHVPKVLHYYFFRPKMTEATGKNK